LTALRWLKELFGLPAAWQGAITSGGTMSNLVGLAAARQWVGTRLGFDPARDGLGGRPPILVLASSEIHISARKALGTLGLGRESVRQLPARDGVIDLAALDTALTELAGPVIVVANGGEVNTGAFDPLDRVAARCAAHPAGAWLHVDAAFGLFAALAPSRAHLLGGIERADSVAADAHKWLNVPYDSGFAFVRDGAALRGAFATSAAYLAPGADAGWDPESHVAEMSRRFRALAVWSALKAAGRAGYLAIVERCLANAAAFAAWVESSPGLELMAPANLNIVCFRCAPAGWTDAATDDLNRDVVAALQADGRVFVSGTVWRGRAAIRAAFDNWATGPADLELLQEAVADVGKRLSERHERTGEARPR
jgi:glutamate/tyrosine decarboxylase-like PLP-dependent enzyme